MPNPVDQDRLSAKTNDGKIVDLNAYRAAAERANAMSTITAYTDPVSRVMGGMAFTLLVVVFLLFLASRR